MYTHVAKLFSVFTLMCVMFLPSWQQPAHAPDRLLLLNPDAADMNRRAPDRFHVGML